MNTFRWRVVVLDGFDRVTEETPWSTLYSAERARERLRDEYARNPECRIKIENRD